MNILQKSIARGLNGYWSEDEKTSAFIGWISATLTNIVVSYFMVEWIMR